MDLTALLYKNGYPPEWDEEVFEKVMEQAENFKKKIQMNLLLMHSLQMKR